MTDTESTGHGVALEYLERAILSGDLRVGTQLPAERALAAQLGIGRGAVREALRKLQAQGIIESLPGPGRGTRIISGQSAALGRIFELHLAIATMSVDDLYTARVALEGATASLAATHADDDQLAELKGILQQMEMCSDLPAFNLLDTRFHVCVAQAARTHLIGDLTSAIRQALRDPILAQSVELANWQVFRLGLVRQHRSVYDAICAHDAALAEERMKHHIRDAAEKLWREGGENSDGSE